MLTIDNRKKLPGDDGTLESILKGKAVVQKRLEGKANPDFFTRSLTDDDYIRIGQEGTKDISERTFGGTIKDIGVSAAKGVVGFGEAAIGIADIPTLGRVGKAMEDHLGYDSGATQAFLSTFYSDVQKEAFSEVERAKGFWDTTKAMLGNPSTIAHALIESGPQMLGSAAMARKLLATGVLKASPIWRGILASAAGEGTVSAGATAEGIRTQTEDGFLTAKQAAISVASGFGTGAFAVIGGRVSNKLGIGDVDVFLAGGSSASAKGVIKRIIGGGISEGAFEELPQSMQEQVWLNAAMDKPLLDGVAEAGAAGLLTGIAMGGGFGAIQGKSEKKEETAKDILLDETIEKPDATAKDILTEKREPLPEDPAESLAAEEAADAFKGEELEAAIPKEAVSEEKTAQAAQPSEEKKKEPKVKKGWKGTPADDQEVWDKGIEKVYDKEKENEPAISKLKKELDTLKSSRKKPDVIRKKEIKQEISELKSQSSLMESELEMETIDSEMVFTDDARKKAEKAGVKEDDLDDFTEEFALEISQERPYIETNFNKTMEQIFDEVVTEYLPKKADAVEIKDLKTKKDMSKSKVVDDSGKPLLVHHGTKFESLDPSKGDEFGIFFSASESTAAKYAETPKTDTKKKSGVISGYIDLQNPLVVDFKGEESHDFYDEVQKAQEAGNDGVILKNVLDAGVVEDQYVVFDPKSQVEIVKDSFGKAEKPTVPKPPKPQATEKPVAKGKEKPAKPTAPMVPLFKTTEQALSFGKKATPEQTTELKRLWDESVEKAKDLTGQAQADAGYRTQLYREAYEEATRPSVAQDIETQFKENEWLKDHGGETENLKALESLLPDLTEDYENNKEENWAQDIKKAIGIIEKQIDVLKEKQGAVPEKETEKQETVPEKEIDSKAQEADLEPFRSGKGFIQGRVINPQLLSDPSYALSFSQQDVDPVKVVNDLASRISTIDRTVTEGFPEGRNRDIQDASDLLSVKTFREQLQSLVKVPSKMSDGGVKSSLDKAASDGASADSHLFGDSRLAYAIRIKGFESLNIDDKGVVQRSMVASLQDSQVFKSIVELIPINVVNSLVDSQLAAKDLLQNQSMLLDRLSRPLDGPIGVEIGRIIDSIATSLPQAFVLGVAEKITSISDSGMAPVEQGTAKRAMDIGHGKPPLSKKDISTEGVDSQQKILQKQPVSIGKNTEGEVLYEDGKGRYTRTASGIKGYVSRPISPAGDKQSAYSTEELYDLGKKDYLTSEEVSQFDAAAGKKPDSGKGTETKKGTKPWDYLDSTHPDSIYAAWDSLRNTVSFIGGENLSNKQTGEYHSFWIKKITKELKQVKGLTVTDKGVKWANDSARSVRGDEVKKLIGKRRAHEEKLKELKVATLGKQEIEKPFKEATEAAEKRRLAKKPTEFEGVDLSQITVDVRAIRESTGEVVRVKEKADVALAEINNELETYYQILACLE